MQNVVLAVDLVFSRLALRIVGEARGFQWMLRRTTAAVCLVAPKTGAGANRGVRRQINRRGIALRIAVPHQRIIESRDLKTTIRALIEPVDDRPAEQALELLA